MRNIIVMFGMLFCLFCPTIVFTMIGHRSMVSLGNRPSGGGHVMVNLIMKLFLTAMVLIGILMFFLNTYLR